MFNVIILDIYQISLDNYNVTFSGSLSDCEGQTRHSGTAAPWLKSDYVERSRTPKSLIGPLGNSDAGWILALDTAVSVGAALGGAALATSPVKKKSKSRKPRSHKSVKEKAR
jgi:hypothetical protein